MMSSAASSSSSSSLPPPHRPASSSLSIYWFRNALRFHDNPSLLDACGRSDRLLPLYIIDPDAPFAQTPHVKPGCLRANFVLESMREVDTKLRARGSQLLVIRGKPTQILPELIASMGVTDLYYEQEVAAPVRASDESVLRAIRDRVNNEDGGGGGDGSIRNPYKKCKKPKCAIHGYDTHTLRRMEAYLAKSKDGKTAPATFGGFAKIFQQMTIPKEVEDVTEVPRLPPDAVERLGKTFGNGSLVGIPSLQDLGYDEAQLKNRAKGGIDFVGGEDFALQLLSKMMSRTQWVARFEKPKTRPNAPTVDTTGLSPCKYCLSWH